MRDSERAALESQRGQGSPAVVKPEKSRPRKSSEEEVGQRPMKALALLGLIGLRAALPPGLPTGLIDAASVVPELRIELRYATSRNLVGRPVSHETRCFLRPEAARALRRAQATVRREGFTLVAWDCYRPRKVQELLWEKQ